MQRPRTTEEFVDRAIFETQYLLESLNNVHRDGL